MFTYRPNFKSLTSDHSSNIGLCSYKFPSKHYFSGTQYMLVFIPISFVTLFSSFPCDFFHQANDYLRACGLLPTVDFPNCLLWILFSTSVIWKHACMDSTLFRAWPMWPLLQTVPHLRASVLLPLGGTCCRCQVRRLVITSLASGSTHYWRLQLLWFKVHLSLHHCQVLLHIFGTLTLGVYARR